MKHLGSITADKDIPTKKYVDAADGIPFGTVDNTSTATAYTATVEGITQLKDGTAVMLKNGVVTSAAGFTIDVNGLGAKPVYNNMAAASAETTMFNINYTMLFVFDSTRVSGGAWILYRGYNSDTTIGRGVIDYYYRPYAGETIYRYKLCMQGEDNRLYPIVVTNQTKTTQVAKQPTTVGLRASEGIWYYGSTTTVSAGSAVGAQLLYPSYYLTTAMYNFNTSTGTYKNVYLRGTYNKDTDLFTLYNDGAATPTSYYAFVPSDTANITLSSYFVSGYYYILVGGSYSTTNYVSLFDNNPIYYFDGTNLIPVSTKVAQDLVNGISIPTKTSDLTNDSGFVSDASYVHTDNNFTTTLKDKLDGIASGAEVNVNADWNANSGDAQILNKPTNVSSFTNDAGYQTAVQVQTAISGKQDTLTFDNTPTSNSDNPVKSGGVYTALSEKQDTITASGLLKGNGSGTITAAVSGTDYQAPLPSQSGNNGKFLTTNGSAMSWGSVPTPPSAYTSNPEMDGTASAGSSTSYAKGDHVHPSDTSKQNKITANGLLKGNGSGTISAAVAGTDYQSPLTAGTDYQTPLPSQSGNNGKFLTTNGSAMSWGSIPSDSNKQDKITANGILKGNGSGGVSAAVSGTDYQAPLTFDNTPTANSNNPVKSSGIKSYVDNICGDIETALSTINTALGGMV